MNPPLLVGDGSGQVRTIRSTDELTDLDRILPDLGHDADVQGRSLRDRVEDADSNSGVSDDKLLELAEWTYRNVEEVWSGFNLIADVVAKGARFRGAEAPLQIEGDVERLAGGELEPIGERSEESLKTA